MPPSTLAADPGFLLSRVGGAVRSGLARLLARWQLRPLQYRILGLLDSHGGLSQKELCHRLGIKHGSLVGLVDGLEALEYAGRNPDRDYHPQRYLVTISPLGRAVLSEAAQAVDEYTREFLSPLTETERRQLTTALTKLFGLVDSGDPAIATIENAG
jgi:DNA-binding MarR family transcriptional regulator